MKGPKHQKQLLTDSFIYIPIRTTRIKARSFLQCSRTAVRNHLNWPFAVTARRSLLKKWKTCNRGSVCWPLFCFFKSGNTFCLAPSDFLRLLCYAFSFKNKIVFMLSLSTWLKGTEVLLYTTSLPEALEPSTFALHRLKPISPNTSSKIQTGALMINGLQTDQPAERALLSLQQQNHYKCCTGKLHPR